MKTVQSFAVKLIPFFQIFETFTLIFNDKMSMSRAEGLPHRNLFVNITLIAVFYGIFYNVAYLLFQQVYFFNL